VAIVQLVMLGQNQYINTAAMITNISLLTGGEAIKLKKLFQKGCLFLACRRAAGLAVLLVLGDIALLYLYSCSEYHRAAPGLFIEKLTQGIFDFSIDETPFKRMSTAAT